MRLRSASLQDRHHGSRWEVAACRCTLLVILIQLHDHPPYSVDLIAPAAQAMRRLPSASRDTWRRLRASRMPLHVGWCSDARRRAFALICSRAARGIALAHGKLDVAVSAEQWQRVVALAGSIANIGAPGRAVLAQWTTLWSWPMCVESRLHMRSVCGVAVPPASRMLRVGRRAGCRGALAGARRRAGSCKLCLLYTSPSPRDS